MKYYALNQNNEYYEFHSWEDLIKWLYLSDLRFVGHNLNDTYVTFFPIFKNGEVFGKPKHHKVNYVIFDSIWRVVDKQTLVKGLEERHNENLRNKRPWRFRGRPFYFEYRREPVPGTSKWKNGSDLWRSIRKNKSYAAKLEEYYHLFPNDAKMRDRKWLVKMWNDDLGMRTQDKSWKRQNKVKKQWQKNAP